MARRKLWTKRRADRLSGQLYLRCPGTPDRGDHEQPIVHEAKSELYLRWARLGRLVSESNPESGTTTYVYDTTSVADLCGGSGRTSYGDLLQKKDANGVTTCYIYDALHRLTDVGNSAYSASNPCKRFRYDNSSGVLGTRPSGVTISNPYGRRVEAETDDCTWPPTGTHQLTDEWFSYSSRGENSDTYEMTPNSAGYHHFNVSYWANYVPSTVKGWLPNGTLDYEYSNLLEGEGRISSVQAGAGGSIALVQHATHDNGSTGSTTVVVTLNGVSAGDLLTCSVTYGSSCSRHSYACRFSDCIRSGQVLSSLFPYAR